MVEEEKLAVRSFSAGIWHFFLFPLVSQQLAFAQPYSGTMGKGRFGNYGEGHGYTC